MNKKLFFILPTLALLLAGCNKSQEVEESKEETTISESTSTNSQTSSQESNSEGTSSEQSSGDESSSSQQDTSTHRIHVPALFSNFYVWSGMDSMAAWPGTALAEEDETWKIASFDAGSYVNIIFNGSEGQTADLDIPAAGEWWMQVGANKEAGKYAARFVDSKPAETTFENTVQVRHYDITVNGVYEYYYCWQDQGAPVTAAWPGDPLVEKHAIFDVALTGSFKIIFNGQYGQTSDLDLPEQAGSYTWTGTEFVGA